MVFAIAIIVFMFTWNHKNSSDDPIGIDAFAKCLTEKDFKMYGTGWCSHCQNQKALFGESFEFVDYTDCDKDRQICLDVGVTGYPTWISEADVYPGVQSLERLASLSGCDLS